MTKTENCYGVMSTCESVYVVQNGLTAKERRICRTGSDKGPGREAANDRAWLISHALNFCARLGLTEVADMDAVEVALARKGVTALLAEAETKEEK